MSQLRQNPAPFGQSSAPTGSGNSVLDVCRDILQAITDLERQLDQLETLHGRFVNEAEASGSSTQRQMDAMAADTMSSYRSLTQRVRELKSKPESRQPINTRQVNNVDTRLKDAIRRFQRLESQFRKKTTEGMERQYRIARPDMSEAEIKDAVQNDTGGQIFQQALMQSGRQRQAGAVLQNVRARHEELQKIEQQMIELAQLFQDMDTLVVQQEVAIAQIEQKGEEVVEHLDKGNEELVVAVKSAKAARKKKWWCLGICGTLRSCYLYPVKILLMTF
jgi:syntaxin 1B/2/3